MNCDVFRFGGAESDARLLPAALGDESVIDGEHESGGRAAAVDVTSMVGVYDAAEFDVV